ncbi:MAG TPA: glycosyltransferase family 2 protein [Rhodocyclaceae bacterium]|nr:glycosyltransferase family 2 protein [Rhodocyclaceae bacterium]
MQASETIPELAVVVPVHNETENVEPLLAEIQAALAPVARFEAIYVDDGSTDATPAILAAAAARFPFLRVLRHRKNCGQSSAILTGVRAARAPLVATLDGDGQNDPADIPALLARWRAEPADGRPVLAAGQRTRRQDTWVRRMSSRIANGVRSRLLGDSTPDTGCGLKLFAR